MTRAGLLSILFTLFLSSNSWTQEQIEVTGAISGRLFLSSSSLPFWFYANTDGFIKKESTYGTSAYGLVEYSFLPNTSLRAGLSVLHRDGSEQFTQRGNLFLSFQAKYYKITLGSKDNPRANTLSTTNENILLSGNSRPFPGVVIESPEYIAITNRLSVDYGIGHYVLNDDRFVKDTRVHYKRLNVKYDTESSGSFSAGIQHFAQWGGTSPVSGDLPDSAGDFIKIFFAQSGGDNSDSGEQVNALGNHLGSFDFTYQKIMRKGRLKIYHLHIFDDGSGTAFKNFPDGVWGIDYKFGHPSLITNILYEYVDTRSQSGSSGRSGRDNYFSNKGYRSGWTYEGQIIGIPFFELNPETGLGITNNRIIAHHIAAFVEAGKIDILGKLTYVQNLGTYAVPFTVRQKQLLSMIEGSYSTKKLGDFQLALGLDILNDTSNNLGLSIGYRYIYN